MWRVQDAIRQSRRLSAREHLNSLHLRQLQLERDPSLRPSFNAYKYVPVGGLTGRLMLVSWLFREATNLSLSPSTSALAVTYLERVLARVHLPLCSAQDFAATCLLIAIKMEEVGGDAMEAPDEMTVEISLELEVYVLQSLQWKLVCPTAYTFLCMYGERVWLPRPARKCAYNQLKHILLCKLSASILKTLFPSPTKLE